MKNLKLFEKVDGLPRVPGVYLFKNIKGTAIYIGKAKDLKSRVKSYFVINIQKGTKTAALVEKIVDLKFIEVATELEALILEAELIKKYKPKYNVALKDDKSSLSIIIRNEKVVRDGKRVGIPRVLLLHEAGIKKGDKVFGPYPHGRIARYLLRSVRKMFRFRNCSPSKFQRYNKLEAPCFYGHIGLCSAPCTNNVSLEEYKKDIKRIEKLLQGKSPGLIKSIEKEMKNLAKQENFEEAANKRDLLRRISYVSKRFREPSEYINNPYLIEDLIAESLDELVENIPDLQQIPKRIECYDISNLSGKEATGSMVVAISGRHELKEYRRFKIRLKDTPDDYEMMREVLRRRFRRERSRSKSIKKWGKPNLLVMDGGKGQVSAAVEVLDEFKLNIPVVGLAKRNEKIILKNHNEVELPRDNKGLKLLQRLRDEAHRFARDYHLKLRLRKLV